MFVTPVSLYEVLILKQHINPCHIFSAQYPKGNAKAPLWIIPQGPILVFVALSAWEYLFILQTNMYWQNVRK